MYLIMSFTSFFYARLATFYLSRATRSVLKFHENCQAPV